MPFLSKSDSFEKKIKKKMMPIDANLFFMTTLAKNQSILNILRWDDWTTI